MEDNEFFETLKRLDNLRLSIERKEEELKDLKNQEKKFESQVRRSL